MTQPRLTDVQRMILANQHEILAILKQDEAHQCLAEQLRDGHEWLYSQELGAVSPTLSEVDTEFVVTILEIYTNLQNSFRVLADATGILGGELQFPGFDGATEAGLLRFSRALYKSKKYRCSLASRGGDSHAATRDRYGRMITRWEDLGTPAFPLSREQISSILGSQRDTGYAYP